MKKHNLAAALIALSITGLAPLSARADNYNLSVGDAGVSIGIEIGSIEIGTPPPPVRVEVVPAPREGYHWAPGYWRWEGHRHHWIEGRWVEARPGYTHVPGHWMQVGERWRFVPERWEEHRLVTRYEKEHYEHDRRHADHRYEERR